MSSGMNFMYGHIFGGHARKPHIDTVRAIRKSNIDPYITAPFGVDPAIARPGPRNTPFLEEQDLLAQRTGTNTRETPPSIQSSQPSAYAPPPSSTTNDIDDLINMITSDPELKTKPVTEKTG